MVRIRTDSSETVFVTIFYLDSESERIVCGYEYKIGVYRKQIWTEYGSVADKHFVGSLVDNKVKLACKFFYVHKYIFI
jgi:hypothetical protein